MKPTTREEFVPREEALHWFRLALRRIALLHHHYATALIEELGKEKGEELIAKVIRDYGTRLGAWSRDAAREMGLDLIPENYVDDLPAPVWITEEVLVDGEKRERCHFCPLASEWISWGDPGIGRLYCGVDQATIHEFNPDYDCVHVKNVLDGDPYCELVYRCSKGDSKNKR